MHFCILAEIQDGRQIWRENDFWEKSPVDSTDTLGVKNFNKIALSCTVSEVNAFLRFTQKFKMPPKMAQKTIFGKSHQLTLLIPWGSKLSTKLFYHAQFPR